MSLSPICTAFTASAEGTEPDEAYWEKHTKFLKSLTGNYRADVAAGLEVAKRTLQQQSSTTETQPKGGDPDLLKRIEQLEGRLAESAKNATANNLRSEVTAKGKSLKVANEAIWEDAVKAVQIGDNDTSEDVTAKAKKEIAPVARIGLEGMQMSLKISPFTFASLSAAASALTISTVFACWSKIAIEPAGITSPG